MVRPHYVGAIPTHACLPLLSFCVALARVDIGTPTALESPGVVLPHTCGGFTMSAGCSSAFHIERARACIVMMGCHEQRAFLEFVLALRCPSSLTSVCPPARRLNI